MKAIILAGVLCAAASAQVFDHDTFTATAGTVLSSHTGDAPQSITWARDSFFSGTVIISPSGEARNSAGAQTNDGLYRASGVPASADYTVQADFLEYTAATGYAALAARTANGGTGYLLVYFSATGTWQFYYFTGAGSAVNLGAAVTDALAIGTPRRIRFTVTGTTLNAYKDNATSPFLSRTDSGLSAAGLAGIDINYAAGATDSTTVHLENFWAYNGAAVVGGTITGSLFTSSSLTVTMSAASGGASPYTYQWYRSTSNGFTPGAGNILGGATSISYADSGLSLNTTTYYYVCVVTDAAGISANSAQYAIGGTVVTGTATVGSVAATTASVTSTSPTGGTPPYTYQWYRSTTIDFTPGAGNLVASATALTLNDTGLNPATTYYYKLIATDSATTTATTLQAAALTSRANTYIIGFIGDSITAGTGVSSQASVPTQAQRILQKFNGIRTVTASIDGVSGTTTADWKNGTGGASLATAITQFNGASVTHVSIMLGTNDAKTGVAISQATYQSNMQSIVNTLIAGGYTKIIVNAPPYAVPGSYGLWDTASTVLLQEYVAALQALALANPTTVSLGDTSAYYWFQANQSQLGDGIHPNDNGAISLGALWANGFAARYMPSPSVGAVTQ